MSKSKKAAKPDALRDDVLACIALNKLGLETLAERNLDRLDFHDLGVVSIRAALEAAYAAGKRVGQREGAAIGYVHGQRSAT